MRSWSYTYAVDLHSPPLLQPCHGETVRATTAQSEGDIATILQASVETKIGELRANVALIRQDLRNATARITEAKFRLSVEKDILQLKEQVKQILSHTNDLHRCAEGTENHSQRNNLRLVGVPEGAEPAQVANFVEESLKSWMPPGALSIWFAVERAHRALMPRLTP